MTSFVFQPWKEEQVPASPRHALKQRQDGFNSTQAKPNMRSSLKSSINRTADNLKKSITLEERGITYGKKMDSSHSIPQATKMRRMPKIDCSHGPSEMIESPAMLLVNSYAEINPQKSLKNSMKVSSEISEKKPSHINEKDQKVNGAVPPLNGEINSAKKKQANSSALRQKKSKTKIDLTSFVLAFILIFFILSVKNQEVKAFVNQTLVPFYSRYLYNGFLE